MLFVFTPRWNWEGEWRWKNDRKGRRCGGRATFEIFAQRLEDFPVEEFHVAVLDSQHRGSDTLA